MINLKDKIQKRISPVPLMQYEIRKMMKGSRKFKTANKYGRPIDFHGGDHLHIYATLRCCLDCYFCINKLVSPTGKPLKFIEHSIDEWSEFLNRLWNIKELYFNGGEHFLLPWFADLINSLDGFNILIFSNLPRTAIKQFESLRKGTNNIIIKSSFHPLNDEPLNLYVERCQHINPEILWTPHVIGAEGISTTMYLDGFRRYGIYATGEMLVYNKAQAERQTQQVECRTMEHQIGPNMKMYRCLVHMLKAENGSDIDDYSFMHDWIKCNYYPRCNTCSAYNQIRWIKNER